jgi:hypothetical protein
MLVISLVVLWILHHWCKQNQSSDPQTMVVFGHGRSGLAIILLIVAIHVTNSAWPQPVISPSEWADSYLHQSYYTTTILESSTSPEWYDISGHGHLSPTSQVDDYPLEKVKLPSSYPFFGHSYNVIYISPNGYLTPTPSRIHSYPFGN